MAQLLNLMGKPLSSFQQKVDWMTTHQEVWACWPKAARSDDQIKQMMVKDGLISPKSHGFDILDFGKLVGSAREQIKKLRRKGTMAK